MSKENPDTRLALFNRQEGRGDIMTIPLEDGVRLASLSKKSFSDVLYSLFQWWTKGKDCPPKNDILRMLYEGMKEHQIQNAVKRGVNLEKWKKASDEALEKRKLKSAEKRKSPSGDQVVTKWTPSGSSIKDKVEDKDKDEVISPLSLSSVEGDKSRADAALVPSLSVEDAKRELAIIAPQISSHPCMKVNKSPTAECRRWIEGSLCSVVRETANRIFDRPEPSEDGYDNDDEYEDALAKYNGDLESKVIKPVLKEVGIHGKDDESKLPKEDADAFKRAYVHAMIEADDDETMVDGKPIRNKTAFVIARMKRAKEAVIALKQKPNKAGNLSDVEY